MRHDDESVLAKGRFFASIDRMVNEVSVADDSCGDVLPAPEAGSLLKNGNHRAYVPPTGEEGEGTNSPVELMGDWSWRPDMQVKDPGYIFSPDEIELVNLYRDLSVGGGANERRSMECGMAAVKPRPWMVPAYKGSAPRPARINSIR